jgi:hypothetical protein
MHFKDITINFGTFFYAGNKFRDMIDGDTGVKGVEPWVPKNLIADLGKPRRHPLLCSVLGTILRNVPDW